MKTKLNQSKIKLAIVSAIVAGPWGLAPLATLPPQRAPWLLARQFRCPALFQPER